MTTEADLIAAITAAPDEPGGFLVYADWLQSKGDPRGELITLMNAGDDKRVAQLMKANRDAFLGPLARLTTSVKLETWRLGFVDHVKLVADDEKHALQLLDVIADHPSCRFVRKLEVLILGKRRSYAGVDARLVELGRPATLEELVLGKTGEHVPSAALREVFPLLAAAPRATWPQISAAIDASRATAPAFAADDVVAVVDAEGRGLPVTHDELLRGLAAEVGRGQPIGLVARLHEDCTPELLDRYAASLVTAWTLHGEEPESAWAYDAASLLGGARAAFAIGRRIEGVSHARAEHAVGCLARMRSPLATLELFALSRHWGARGERAQAAVEAAARRAKLDVLTLLALAGSDPRDAFDDATLARFREIDLRIVELLMTTGWSAPLATVVDLFARAPRHAWSSWLVWQTAIGRLPYVFALDAEGPVDLDGRRMQVPADATCSLAHVAEPAVDLESWRRWQRQHQPAFEQLDRPAGLEPSLAVLAELIDVHTDVDTLRARGYRNGGVKNELHQETQFVKTHPYRGTTYTIAVEPNWGNRRLRVVPSAVPRVVLHELARDIAATRRSR